MCGKMLGGGKSVAIPTVEPVVMTKAPSLADGTAANLAASSKRRNAAAGQKQTLLGGDLGAADTLSGKTLLGG